MIALRGFRRSRNDSRSKTTDRPVISVSRRRSAGPRSLSSGYWLAENFPGFVCAGKIFI
jgi:hypothetical protein